MAYKRNKVAENAIAKRNKDFLDEYDLQTILQRFQEQDHKVMQGVYTCYSFLYYCTAGLFMLYTWLNVIKAHIKLKKNQKEQKKQNLQERLVKQTADLEKNLAAQRIDPNAICCMYCHKTNGTLVKVAKGMYVHSECVEKVKEKKR